MTDLMDIAKEALARAGHTHSQEGDPTSSTGAQVEPGQTLDTEKLITQCVMEIVQMPCYDVKQLADIRRTLRSVLKALIKESEYITIGVIKRYVDPRNRALVKSVLNRMIDIGLVCTATIESSDTIIYQINHVHADTVFNYLERVL